VGVGGGGLLAGCESKKSATNYDEDYAFLKTSFLALLTMRFKNYLYLA
jgi:hypothetical protein